MHDLIERQAAIEAIDKIFPADPMRNDYTQGITCGAALATEYIKQLPSSQPEHTNNRVIKQTLDEVYAHAETEAEARYHAEIVRCKDCRYYQDNNGGYPHMNCKWDANETPDEDDFCSGAERRTDVDVIT